MLRVLIDVFFNAHRSRQSQMACLDILSMLQTLGNALVIAHRLQQSHLTCLGITLMLRVLSFVLVIAKILHYQPTYLISQRYRQNSQI